MKKYIPVCALLLFFFAETHSSIGQELKKQPNYTTKKMQLNEAQNSEVNKEQMTPETIAKQQSLHLQHLLNLDEDQAIKTHKICLYVENGISKIPNDVDQIVRMDEINNFEIIRTEQLKKILTADQFQTYQNSIKRDR